MKDSENVDVETYTIGSVLVVTEDSMENFGRCEAAGVTHKSFTYQQNQIVWDSMSKVYRRGCQLDPLIVSQQLQTDGVLESIGGIGSLLDYAHAVETSTRLDEYIKILRNNELKRDLLRIAMTAGDMSTKTENAQDVVDYLDKEIGRLGSSAISDKTRTMSQIAQDGQEELLRMVSGQPFQKGLLTGFPSFDSLINGLQPKSMVVIAARPSVGKTAIVMNFAENIIAHSPGKRILFFSLEMDGMSILQRIVSSISGVPISRMRDGLVSEEQKRAIKQATEALCSNDNLMVNDSSDMTISQIRAVARHKALRGKIDLIIVDYLQFVQAPGQSKDVQTAEISRGMKAMAKELGCPVVVLSQLNRDSEKTDRRPKLSDLRDSGAIEQDADVVAFLWPNVQEGIVELLVAKNRTGPIGKIDLVFKAQITQYREKGYMP